MIKTCEKKDCHCTRENDGKPHIGGKEKLSYTKENMGRKNKY